MCFGTAASPKPVSSHTNTAGSDKGWCRVPSEPVRFSISNPVKREWKQMHLDNCRKHGLCSANKIKAFKKKEMVAEANVCMLYVAGWGG